MRSRSLAAQHDAVVARRLELLTSELAAVRAPEEAAEDEACDMVVPLASVARLPGRHASRRTALTGLWPGRFAWGAGHVAVVAVLAVASLIITCWWLLRSGGHDVTAPVALTTPGSGLATPRGAPRVSALAAADQPSGGAGPTSDAAGAASAKVVVDVTGKVRRPGIVVLRQGARVVDALRAAGGARPGVDLAGLNLARVLADGEQVVVGAPVSVVSQGSASVSGPAATGL